MTHPGLPLRAGAIALGLLALAPIVVEAILVAPHAVFIDRRTRSAQVFLHNPSSTPEEVEVRLQYGYPDTDSAGNVYIHFVDDPGPEHPSAAGWIRVFPQRVVVAPRQRQVVRLIAQPPADLPAGEYWTRLIASARGAAQPVASSDSNVAAQITLVVNTVISVTYRQGDVQTGLAMESITAEAATDSLVVRVGLRREGNAAWLGTAWVRLRDETGRVVREWNTPMAVYFTQDRRLAYSTEGVPRGRYVAEVELNTRREDISPSHILPAAPVSRSIPVELR